MNTINSIYFILQYIIFASSESSQSYYNDHAEHVRGTVGVGFRYKLNTDRLLGTTTERVNLELLTDDGKELFSTTWIKLQWISNEIYGFPLEGNQGVSTYYVKATTETGFKRLQEIKLFVTDSIREYFHEIKLCTDLTKDTYLKHLDTRYELAEILSKYILDTDVHHIRLKHFHYGCFWFSFTNIEDGISCNVDKVKEIKQKVFDKNGISLEFKKALSKITVVKSVNLTLSGDCIKPNYQVPKKEIKWLKIAAPIMILGAIVIIPIGISCYVCRGVRRRQNKMRQQQDKKFKEEAARINENIDEYKRACGLDEGLDSDSDTESTMPKWKQELRKNEKTVFLTKMFEQYVPKTLQDMVGYKKTKYSDKNKIRRSYNPVSRFLDIRTNNKPSTSTYPNPTRQPNTRLNRDFSVKTSQNFNPNSSTTKIIRTVPSSSKLPLTNSYPIYKTLPTAHIPAPFIPLTDSRRSKSVSFFDVSRRDPYSSFDDTSSSIYRRIDKNFNKGITSQSCSAVDTLGRSYEGILPTANSPTEINQYPLSQTTLTDIPQSNIYSPATRSRKLSVVESVKTFATAGKDVITALKETNIMRRRSAANNRFYNSKDIPIKKSNGPSKFYIGDDFINQQFYDDQVNNGLTRNTVNRRYSSPRDHISGNYPSDGSRNSSRHNSINSVYSDIKNKRAYRIISSNKEKKIIPTGFSWSPGEKQCNSIYFNPQDGYGLPFFQDDLNSSATPSDLCYTPPLTYKGEWSPLVDSAKIKHEHLQSSTIRRDSNNSKNRDRQYSQLYRKDSNAGEKRNQFRSHSQQEKLSMTDVRYPPIPESFAISNYIPTYNSPRKQSLSKYSDSLANVYAPNLLARPQEKIDWRSFESGSSDITYMDFGSEYEVLFENEVQDGRRMHPNRYNYEVHIPYMENFNEEREDYPYHHETDTSVMLPEKGQLYISSIRNETGSQQFV